MTHWTDIPAPTARRRLTHAAAGLAVAALTLTACGNTSNSSGTATTSSAAASSSATSAGSSSSGGNSSQATSITATEAEFSISLDKKSLSAGPYTVTVDNKGQATHDLVVEQGGAPVARTDSIAPGGTASLNVTLKPGDYVFYCSIDGHRSMGMEVNVHVG